MRSFERGILYASVAGFLAHLFVIFLSRHFEWAARLSTLEGANYLAAIYTPFTIILFQEVLVLISAVPQALERSVAAQVEIVSLIYIRGFFHELGELDLNHVRSPPIDLLPRLADDIGGGFILFLLVTVFKRVARRRGPPEAGERLPDTNGFMLSKKAISVGLTILFFVLAAFDLRRFGANVYGILFRGSTTTPDWNLFFYSNVFTVMIFTDVLVLILSLAISGQYEYVFKNAAFVVARILMLFSLLAEQPLALLFAVTGVVLATLTVLVYNYGKTADYIKKTKRFSG
jgi:hypothetical protein